MAKRWHYTGDINLEHGGTFINFSDLKYGYANVVEVTDLDSAIGFSGAILIEERTVITDHKERWPSALSTIGASLLPNGDIDDNGRPIRKDSLAWRMCLVYALSAYGHYDTDRSETLQPDPDGPLSFDSWKATRIRSNGLRAYVRREFLGLSR
jgi:hypothetical protein